MDNNRIDQWIKNYVKAWRSADLSSLDNIFTPTIRYIVSPWKEPIVGSANLKKFWEQSRSGSDESFVIDHTIIAIDGDTTVARIEVTYAHDTPAKWRDLWILTFDDSGLCCQFEEWPFAQDQDDGQHI